jgi:hypothetical protein
MDPKSGNNQQGSRPGAQGSGSDTASAANLGASTGNAGQPAQPFEKAGQSATLASHTSKPLGGSQTGSGQSSQGPEHLRHQDKDAGKGLGNQARAGASQTGQATQSAADTVRQTAQSAADTAMQTAQAAGETVRDAADQVQQRAGDLYDQASQAAGQAAEQATEWARGAYEQGSRQFETMRRSLPDVRQYGGSVQRFVTENPVLVGVVGLAAGLMLGALLPRTRREDRAFGRWADEVREQGMRYARDMTQRGREYVDEALGEGDDRFSSDEGGDWRRGDQRSGPSGRFQNH